MCEGGLTFPPAVVLLIITYSDSSLRPFPCAASLRESELMSPPHAVKVLATASASSATVDDCVVRDCGRVGLGLPKSLSLKVVRFAVHRRRVINH